MVGPVFLLTRLLRLLGLSRVVAVAVAVYLWRKQRGRATRADGASARSGPGRVPPAPGGRAERSP